MLVGAKHIRELYENDEFGIILVVGPHGYGKSSYANRLIAEAYYLNDGNGDKIPNWNISLFKNHIGFHPEEVIKIWKNKTKRDRCFHWDDAGLWLHSLDFQNRFVKAVGKYLQVARSDWATLIFSAIDSTDVVSKIRSMDEAVIVNISKVAYKKDSKYPSDKLRRLATGYILRKGWKGRTYKEYLWKDYFNAHVPGNYSTKNPERIINATKEQRKDPDVTYGFYGWYKPLRNKYSQMALYLMSKSIDDLDL